MWLKGGDSYFFRTFSAPPFSHTNKAFIHLMWG